MKAYEEKCEVTPSSSSVSQEKGDITPLQNSALAAFRAGVSGDDTAEGISRAALNSVGDLPLDDLVESWAALVRRIGEWDAIQAIEGELQRNADVSSDSLYALLATQAEGRCGYEAGHR